MVFGAGLAALGSLASGACGSSGPESGDTLYLFGQPVNFQGTTKAAGKPLQDVELQLRAFSPTFVYGSSSQRLILRLANTSAETHAFAFDHGESVPESPSAESVQIAPGAAVEVTVEFGDSANRVFYCLYHWREGMVGELVRFEPNSVEAPRP